MPDYTNWSANWQWYGTTNTYNGTWTQYSSTWGPVARQNFERTNVKFEDCEEAPADRGDHVKCVNCGRPWLEHWNWSCSKQYTHHRKSDIPSAKRYLTEDMLKNEKKKFSRVSQRKLKKRERELLLSKESLLK